MFHANVAADQLENCFSSNQSLVSDSASNLSEVSDPPSNLNSISRRAAAAQTPAGGIAGLKTCEAAQ